MFAKLLRLAGVLVVAASIAACRGAAPAAPAYDAEFEAARAALALAAKKGPAASEAAGPAAPQAPGSVVGIRQPRRSELSLIPSAWRQPGGSISDRSIWENFMFETDQEVTELRWQGGYDPARGGSGGPLLNFTVDIYTSIPTGSEPDTAAAPVVHYVTNSNAGERLLETDAGAPLYEYRYVLPSPFRAKALTPYWVQIVGFQAGEPDWGFAEGSLGDGRHFRLSGAAGEGYYHQLVPDDIALEVLVSQEGGSLPAPEPARSLEEIAEQMANLPPAEEIPLNADGVQEVMLVVSRSGYTPVHFAVRAGVPVRLTFRQLGYVPGGNELNVRWGPDEGTYVMLSSLTDKKTLEFTPTAPGDFRYSCPHEWYWGVMTVRE